MTGSSTPRRAAGFTLIELLVTIFLFSTASVILSQIFVSFNQLHRKVANSAVLGQDARFAMELLVREARSKLIDYNGATYSPSQNFVDFISRDGSQRVQVAVKGPADIGVCEDPALHCLALQVNGGGWNALTSKHVDVTHFYVMVRPASDPFDPVTQTNVQPFVTFNINMNYIGNSAKDSASLQTQTSVSSRIYSR